MFFWGLGFVVQAQVITPSLPVKQREFPLVFPTDEAGNTLLLFFSRDKTASKNFSFQVAVVDASSELLALDSVTAILAAQPGDKNLTPLCLFADATTQYALFKAGDRNIYQVHIDPVSRQVRAQVIGQLDAREQLLGGLTLRQGAAILTRSGSGDNPRSLNIYQPEGGALKKSSFQKGMPDFFNRSNYTPLMVQPGADMWPNKAVHPDKIIADGHKIYLLYDKTPNIYSKDVLSLQMVTIDVQADTLYSETVQYPNEGKAIEGASGSSYIFESKLFQVYFDYQKFGLRVRNLPDQTMLFERYMTKNDSLFLIQSEIDFWGGRKLTRPNASELLRRLKSVMPFIYVKRSGATLILGLGGYEESLRGGENSGPNEPNQATPLRPAGESNIVFYTSMQASGRQLANHQFSRPAITRIYQDLNIPKNGVFSTINGQSKYLYYDHVIAGQPFQSLVILQMAD